HQHNPLRDEERTPVRREHAQRGVAAATAAGGLVVVENGDRGPGPEVRVILSERRERKDLMRTDGHEILSALRALRMTARSTRARRRTGRRWRAPCRPPYGRTPTAGRGGGCCPSA